MQLTDRDIDQLDKLVASDSPEKQEERMSMFTNIVTAMSVIHGRARVCSMLRSLADVVDSDEDVLHEAFLMRKEMFADLGEL